MPLPARILGLLWGKHDVRKFDDNLECSTLQRDLITHDLEIPVVLSPRVWSVELVFRVPCVAILVEFLFT